MDGRKFFHFDPGLILALVLPIFILWPLARPGFPDTFDGRVHLYRVVELDRAWHDGMFLPRWAPDLVFGYGMALFNFIPSLPYLPAEILHLLGLTYQAAFKWTIAGILLGYSLGMYIFARRVLGREAALLAAAVFVYAPFRMREAFLFEGNYPQLLAYSLLPWVLWALHRLSDEKSPFHLGIASALTLLLLFSHTVSTMLSLPLLGAYVLCLALARRDMRVLAWGMAALVLAIGLASFYILPAIYEQRWTQVQLMRQEFFDPRGYLLSLGEVFSPNVALDGRSHNPYMPQNLGTAQMLLGGVGILTLLSWRRLNSVQRFHMVFLSVVLVVCVFLMTSSSRFIWEALSFLRFVQRPWRLYGIAGMLVACLAGASFLWLRGQAAWIRGVGLALGLAFTMVSSFVYLYPRPFLDLSGADPAQIVAYEEERGTLGTTSAGEYLSIWTTERPVSSPLVALYQEGTPIEKLDREDLPSSVQARLLSHTVISDEYAFSSDSSFTVRFHTLYFPGWKAFLDGKEIPIAITKPYGLISLDVPAGEHRLLVRFEDTPVRKAGKVISGASFLVLAVAIVWQKGRSREPVLLERSGGASFTWGYAILLAMGLGALLGIKVLFIDPHTSWFRKHSPMGEVIGVEHPAHIDLEGKVTFLGYDLEKAVVRQGEALQLVLYWQAQVPLGEDLRSFVHLDSFPSGITQATFDNLHPGDIPTSLWLPALYVRDEYLGRIPKDMPPTAYLLRVGMYSQAGGERLTAKEEGKPEAGEILLTTINVARRIPLDPKALPNRQKQYALGEDIQLLGYRLEPSSPARGESLDIALFWQAKKQPSAGYTVFVHLLDEGGKLVAQADGPPLEGAYPTSTWLPREVIEDGHRLAVPGDLAAGNYRLAIGLYRPDTLERLPAEGPEGPLPGDMVLLAEFAIKEAK